MEKEKLQNSLNSLQKNSPKHVIKINRRKTLTGIRRVVITKNKQKIPKDNHPIIQTEIPIFSFIRPSTFLTLTSAPRVTPRITKVTPKVSPRVNKVTPGVNKVTPKVTPKQKPKKVTQENAKEKVIKEQNIHKNKNVRPSKDISVLTNRIQKSIFRPRHTLISHGQVYNVCKTCPSYLRKRLKVLK